MKNAFVAARGVRSQLQTLNSIDLFNIDCFTMNGQTGDQMIALVKQAIQTNTLLVFLFHGVGGEHALNVTLAAHHQLIAFLKENEQQIWIAPLIDIARYIKTNQQPSNSSK